VNGGNTVGAALAEARRRGIASLDAQLLLGRLLGKTRTQLIAGDDAALDPPTAARWLIWLDRRAAGEPVAYLLGEKEFRGLLLAVNRAVLVPRPETELLVEWALERIADRTGPTVLDLGTGSGAIALAIRAARPDARVVASDASEAALTVARRNAERLGLATGMVFVAGSWWEPLADRRFDVVVANPPYIREGDPALRDLGHEPASALVAGEDGLASLRHIAAGAALHLEPGGWLLLEHGFDQADDVAALLGAAGLDAVETRRDLAGHPRATGGRRTGGS
jgi:release factor glutamine methyltransferase